MTFEEEQSPVEIASLVALVGTDGFGPVVLRKLREHFDSYEEILFAEESRLTELKLGEKLRSALGRTRREFLPEKILEPYRKYNIKIIPLQNSAYPELLREIPSAPPVLFVRGNIKALNRHPSVTVIGSRRHTDYGKRSACSLTDRLARSGITIISGLALGIDAVAHRAALDAGGITVGVLGSGLDDTHIQPRGNFSLAREMCLSGGAIVSEYPVGTAAAAYTFPARNRIMAALGNLTLVVEAADKSGTLITAGHALDFGRDVMAVPGSIFSEQSRGTHKLIAAGAKIVTDVEDILAELGLNAARENRPSKRNKTSSLPTGLTEAEEKIWKLLSEQPLEVNKIIAGTKLSGAEATAALTTLEIAGHVRHIGGGRYIRNIS